MERSRSLWRVFPYDPAAEPGAPFSAATVPRGQGAGRFDLPDVTPVWYFAASATHAVAETLQSLRGQTLDAADLDRAGHRLAQVEALLSVVERDAKPAVTVDHRRITLAVRPGSTVEERQRVLHAWYKALPHAAVPPRIAKWQPTLGVRISAYYIQRMKTRWGSCNPGAARIRLNVELVKKPRDLLEYVVVHEMLHLRAPTHSARCVELLSEPNPTWRDARRELNDLPVAGEAWDG